MILFGSLHLYTSLKTILIWIKNAKNGANKSFFFCRALQPGAIYIFDNIRQTSTTIYINGLLNVKVGLYFLRDLLLK